MDLKQPEPNTTKNIILTGAAAKEARGGKRRTTNKSKRFTQDGGAEAQPQPQPQLQQAMNVIKQLAQVQQPGSTPPPPPQAGGAVKQKVSLVPAKHNNKTRVLLAPKQQQQQQQQPSILRSKTKKQKKLSLRVANIRRKVASTRKHIHASTALPIDKIRKELVDAKLLNPASKAPEALIRKIYADFKITTHKA